MGLWRTDTVGGQELLHDCTVHMVPSTYHTGMVDTMMDRGCSSNVVASELARLSSLHRPGSNGPHQLIVPLRLLQC